MHPPSDCFRYLQRQHVPYVIAALYVLQADVLSIIM